MAYVCRNCLKVNTCKGENLWQGYQLSEWWSKLRIKEGSEQFVHENLCYGGTLWMMIPITPGHTDKEWSRQGELRMDVNCDEKLSSASSSAISSPTITNSCLRNYRRIQMNRLFLHSCIPSMNPVTIVSSCLLLLGTWTKGGVFEWKCSSISYCSETLTII